MELIPVIVPGPDQLLFSDRLEDVDDVAVLMLIRSTYFGKERTSPEFLKQCNNSMCFSLFLRNKVEQGFVRQVGFARVVTDKVSFGWVCDVVVEGVYRRRGWGKVIMDKIVTHPKLAGVTLNLGTRDAQTFYAQFGFEECRQMMRRPHA